MESYYIFTAIILIGILGNLGSHFYYKRKHIEFRRSLSENKLKVANNVSVDINSSSSKSLYNYQITKGTVIFLNDHIFLLNKSKFFRQAQPILEISKINNNENFLNIWEEISYISKQKVDNKIRIKGFSERGLVKINYTIILDFNKTDFDLNSVFKSF